MISLYENGINGILADEMVSFLFLCFLSLSFLFLSFLFFDVLPSLLAGSGEDSSDHLSTGVHGAHA